MWVGVRGVVRTSRHAGEITTTSMTASKEEGCFSIASNNVCMHTRVCVCVFSPITTLFRFHLHPHIMIHIMFSVSLLCMCEHCMSSQDHGVFNYLTHKTMIKKTHLLTTINS